MEEISVATAALSLSPHWVRSKNHTTNSFKTNNKLGQG
jgi:hypothetical protein